MTLSIQIPKSVEDRLAEKAKEAGVDLASYVAHVVEAHAGKPTLKELSGPVYEQFVASGMTDEELGEFLENAKHEMRAERRAGRAMASEAERVVFDCVVYAQAVINPNGPAGACLELARDGVLTLCISDYLLTEIRELPTKLSPRLNITPEKIDVFIVDLVSFGRRVQSVATVYELKRDPDDSHYINLAIAAGAKLITSRDRDLLDLMDTTKVDGEDFRLRFPQLRILTPEELLREVRSQSQ